MSHLKELQKDILKWGAVILILLVVPYGSVLLVVAFTIQFFRNKVYNSDLLLLYFLSFFIQNIAGGAGDSGLGNIRYLLIFVGFFKMVGQRRFSYNLLFKKAFYFPALLFFLLLHSLIFSYNTTNSFVEVTSFMLLFFFAFHNTYFENRFQRARIFNNIEAMYIAILALSVISLAIPAIAYARNAVGFQGVGNHPNTFGVILAPFCSWILVRTFQKFSLKNLVITLVSIVLLYLSQSRTSLLSVILGVICIMAINRELRTFILQKSLALMVISASLIVIYFNSISGSVYSFFNKSNSGSISESVLLSRGDIIDRQTYNIESNPWFGIGFKTPSNLVVENAFAIGKPYEKGNMVLAGVEELGIIGFVILLITIISLLKQRANKKNILIILAFTALFTTMGEATLFSIGGIGVLIWAFIFLAFHNGTLADRIGKMVIQKNKNL